MRPALRRYRTIICRRLVARLLQQMQQDVSQYDGLVMYFVLRSIDQRNGPPRRTFDETSQALPLFLGIEFVPVASLELVPSLRLVAEPRPQRGAWRDVARPLTERECPFAASARPDAIN